MLSIATHIVHNGQKLYVLDRIEGERVWYRAGNCWGGPGCDEVQTIRPVGPAVWEPEVEYYASVGVLPPPVHEPVAPVPEGNLGLPVALVIAALACWWRRA
jgi:hypothetical protein